jgi:hypothetical protein
MTMAKTSGNVLVFILLALFLTGALTAFLMRNSGQSDETGDTERATIQAAEVMRYGSGIASTVEKLILNGCSESQISFYSSGWSVPSDYENTFSPSSGDKSCFVFDPAGGGMTLKNFQDGAVQDFSLIFAANRVSSEALNADAGTPEPDLVMLVRVSEPVCRQVNRSLSNISLWESGNVHNGSQATTNDSWVYYDGFKGSFDHSTVINYGYQIIDGVDYQYKIPPKAGCFCDGPNTDCTPPTKFYFYKVLIQR